MKRLPTFYLSHGGGPWPWMDEYYGDMFNHLRESLGSVPKQLSQAPRAVLLITAHWEAPTVTISAGKQPGMVYDYYGFPPNTYDIVYPAPGAPEVAEEVSAALKAGGIEASFDTQRGYDHGTFVPLAVMYPDAEMPVVQMSLHRNLDPATHLKIGQALAPLRDHGVLIIGSGMSFHNLSLMNEIGQKPSQAFDEWLQNAVVANNGKDREQQLLDWKRAPAAHICHPREEHLIPLMVAVGAAENETGTCIYHDTEMFGGITSSSFRFG